MMRFCYFKILIFTLLFCFGGQVVKSHSLPNSTAEIIFHENKVVIRFRMALDIFELASKIRVNLHSEPCIDSIKLYCLKHIIVYDSLKSSWKKGVQELHLQTNSNRAIGEYKELVADVILEPSNPKSLQYFTLYSDIIIHQVVNQSIIYSIEESDYTQSIKNKSHQIGLISRDFSTGLISPLKIHYKVTSFWREFSSMFLFGMDHIMQGSDHLLFLVVSLFPTLMMVYNKRWVILKYPSDSALRILKRLTAFTLGHSITLFIGAWGWFRFPQQPIEVLIAVSILVSAIHCWIPIFSGKETWLILGFGFIHGMAFSSVLLNLGLDPKEILIRLLGFNLGIECIQFGLILLMLPGLLWISRTGIFYGYQCIIAAISGTIALVWIVQRISGKEYYQAKPINFLPGNNIWWILILIICPLLIGSIQLIYRVLIPQKN